MMHDVQIEVGIVGDEVHAHIRAGQIEIDKTRQTVLPIQEHIAKALVPLGHTAGQRLIYRQKPVPHCPVFRFQPLGQTLLPDFAQGVGQVVHVPLLLVNALRRVVGAEVKETVHAHGWDQIHALVSLQEPGDGQDHLPPQGVLLLFGELHLVRYRQVRIFGEVHRQLPPTMEEAAVRPLQKGGTVKAKVSVAADEAIEVVQPLLRHLRGVGEAQHILLIYDVVPADVLLIVGSVDQARALHALHTVEGEQGGKLRPSGMSQGFGASLGRIELFNFHGHSLVHSAQDGVEQSVGGRVLAHEG